MLFTNIVSSTVVLVLAIFTYYTAIFHTVLLYAYDKHRARVLKYANISSKSTRLIVLVPCKREPAEIVVKFLVNNVQKLEKYYATIVYILDEYSIEEIEDILSKFLSVLRGHNVDVIILPSRSSKNKASALNRALRALRLSKDSVITVLDVDSILENIGKLDVAVGSPRWIGYSIIDSKLGRGQVLGYDIFFRVLEGMYSIFRWIPTLGSGLMADLQHLARLGYFSEDVILEDVDFSIKAAREGVSIFYPSCTVRVQVPATYTALLKQQVRWAYGAAQLVRKYFRTCLRRPVVLLYLMQYLTYAGQLLLTVVIDAAVLLNAAPPLAVQLFVYIMFLYASALYPMYLLLRGELTKDKLVWLNRVNMAFVVMSPLILYGLVAGFLNMPFRWIPTPKIESPRGLSPRECRIELVVCIFLTVLTVLALLHDFCILMLISLSYVASYVWGLVRVMQSQLAR